MSAYLAAPLGFLALTLSGCGGGGGGGSGGGGGAPTPPPKPPAPAGPPNGTYACSEYHDCDTYNVLSYNLQWWKTVGQLHEPDKIVDTIKANGNFDLMGFQECDGVDALLNFMDKKYASKQGPQDIAIVWDTTKFKKVSEGDAVVGHDGWGPRHMHWARLQVIGTDKYIVFANTHGPVGQCNGLEQWKEVAKAYTDNIKSASEENDSLFFTGDFNCGSPDQLMGLLRETLYDAAQASWFKPILYQPDHIFTYQKDSFKANWTAVCCPQPSNCHTVSMPTVTSGAPPADAPACIASPSDHMLLHGTFDVPKGKPALSEDKSVVV